MLFALKGDDYFKANFMDPDNMLCCITEVPFLFLVLAGVYIVYILYTVQLHYAAVPLRMA